MIRRLLFTRITPAIFRAIRLFDRVYLAPLIEAKRRYQSTGSLSLLFVCKGNICRSAYACQRFSTLAGDSKKNGVTAVSAGLETRNGFPADSSAIESASGRGIVLNEHRTAVLTDEMAAAADLILVMDERNLTNFCDRYPEYCGKAMYLGALDFQCGGKRVSIPDPFGGDARCFEECFQIIDRSLELLVAQL